MGDKVIFETQVNSQKTVEAFHLYQQKQVAILDANEQQIHGVVFDQGRYYDVKIFGKSKAPVITADGETTLSPFHTPYALAVDFAYQNGGGKRDCEIIMHRESFAYIMPFIMDLQREVDFDKRMQIVDGFFETIEEELDPDLSRILIYLELYHIFERYSETSIAYRELCMAIMDECVESIDNQVRKQTLSSSVCKLVVSRLDSRFESIWMEHCELMVH